MQAVSEALSSVDAERAGLGRRVDELRAWVGGLIGPDDGVSRYSRQPNRS